jgi:DNA-binding LacI/PurR family transcriptional regulator/signal transduction histidine kinase
MGRDGPYRSTPGFGAATPRISEGCPPWLGGPWGAKIGSVTTPPPRRPTVAFLLDNLFDDYEEALWRSVSEAAREEDVNLLCFLGGSLTPEKASRESWARNALFDLVHPDNVDGIILLASSVGIFLEDEELDRFASRFTPIPVVGLGRGVLGFPRLLVDNGAGIADVMDHLIGHHGRRRIAFIRGPPTNNEAEVRFNAYRSSLARHGLAYDEAYVATGDFNRGSGIRAVQTLLDERHLRPDAVVAANDLMALYAMRELHRRGFDVPGEVAVVGFDDVADGVSTIPSLTSVRQPLDTLGRAALHRLVALMRGERVPETETFPARMVIRRSCGCLPVLGRWSAQEAPGDPPAAGPPVQLAEILEQALPDLTPRVGSGWAVTLAQAFGASRVAKLDGLLEALERLMIRALEAGYDALRFYDLIHAMLGSPDARGLDTDRRAMLAESCAQLVGTMAAQAQTGIRVKAVEEAKIFQFLFQPVHVTEAAFETTFLNELPTLGARSFFLCRYADPEGRTAELRAHYDLSGRLPLAPDDGPFPTSQLIPGGLRCEARHAHAVLAVHYLNERIGYMVCELGHLSPGGYESLSTQVSAVLKVSQLLSAVRRQATELEEKVEARTQELRSAQRQLLETAHQAGMAEVAVGVLHNVGNLLNSVSVCAEEIAGHAVSKHGDGLRRGIELLLEHRDDLPGWFASDPRAALLPEYLDKVSAELTREEDRSREEARQLLEKVAVIRDTIRALQDLARHGRQAVLREQIDVGALVDAVLEIQRPLLVRHAVRLRRELGGRLPPLVTERSKLIHVLVNLVKNAVEAMRQRPEGERVLSVLAETDVAGRVRIAVTDTGEGIAAENLDRLFSFGFTTKEDGHGFGLHSCALHASQLGATLEAQSPGPGHGATFTLVLPAEPVTA